MTASLTKESMRNGESESAKFPMTLCNSSIFWTWMKDRDALHRGPDSNLLSHYSATQKALLIITAVGRLSSQTNVLGIISGADSLSCNPIV